MKIKLRAYVELLLIGGLIIALDQWTKYLVRLNLDFMEAWSPWPWLMPYARLLHIHNTGAAFGMGFIQGLHYRVIITHTEYGLDLKFTAKNVSDRTFHHVVGIPCLGFPSDSFLDPAMERTMLVSEDAFLRLKDADRGTGDPWRARYRVRGERPIRFYAAPFWGESSATVATSPAGAVTGSSPVFSSRKQPVP